MVPELGYFAIILALCFALLQSIVPLIKSQSFDLRLRITESCIIGQWLFLSFAMLCLIMSFINNDMTVLFVREHSHPLLPLIYRIGAAWGGHEGSLLLWCLILSIWSVVFIFFARRINSFMHILMILGMVSTGFIAFLVFTSNPFMRDFPNSLIDGNDLTPLLQDPGLIFHPPMLYLGYVGFAIGFAFAIGALLDKTLDKQWVAACRPWIILPWSCLGCGIVLGSWWAYRELGWGGWWFWDPVENASLLPWLSATALIHSLIVTEKRDAFKGWTLLLAIITFALSLLGTFLVRSGVLVSVHAFASDPTRGIFLLLYLAVIIGGALTLYTVRIHYFYQSPRFQLFSRETLLLMNSVILLTAVATIIIGTLYPIILDALQQGKISVGEPYFNSVFIPIMFPLLFLMGIAPFMHWQQHALGLIWKKLRIDLVLSVLLGFGIPLSMGFEFHWLAAIGITIGFWIILATLQYALQHRFSLRHLAMIIAHLGIAMIVLGITINKTYSQERQIKIHPGESVSLAGFEFQFKQVNVITTRSYQSKVAEFNVLSRYGHSQLLSAEERTYRSHEQTLSRPGISYTILRDLYLALGNSFPDGSWAVRIYYKPCVRWIWLGGFLVLIGGLLAIVTKRKYQGESKCQ